MREIFQVILDCFSVIPDVQQYLASSIECRSKLSGSNHIGQVVKLETYQPVMYSFLLTLASVAISAAQTWSSEDVKVNKS